MDEEAPLNTTAQKTQKCNQSAMRWTRSDSETHAGFEWQIHESIHEQRQTQGTKEGTIVS